VGAVLEEPLPSITVGARRFCTSALGVAVPEDSAATPEDSAAVRQEWAAALEPVREWDSAPAPRAECRTICSLPSASASTYTWGI